MNEKLQVAKDESYRDTVNLETKCKKHKEFEAEIRANEARIQTIANVISHTMLMMLTYALSVTFLF